MNDNFCIYHKEMPITKKRGQKKRHTRKNGVKGKMNVYRVGNVIVCTKIPIRIDDRKRGGTKDDEDVKTVLNAVVFSNVFFSDFINKDSENGNDMNTLGNTEEQRHIIGDYLNSLQPSDEGMDKLIDYIMSKKNTIENSDLFDVLNKFNSDKSNTQVQGTPGGSTNAQVKTVTAIPQNKEYIANEFFTFIKNKSNSIIASSVLQKLNDIVKNKAIANTMLNSMKGNSKSLIQQIGQKQFDAMIKALDENGTDGISGALSTMTSSAFNTLKSGSVLLGNFLLPNTGEKPSQTNETNIQFLWHPQEHMHYSKGKSKGRSYDKMKYGDFVILVEPTKYANTKEFFLHIARQVEDLLANLLNGCSNMLCTKGRVKRRPYRKQVFKITDETPIFSTIVPPSN